MKYIVYWKDMLTKGQGSAPMQAFDTTIEGHAYIQGFVDAIVMHTNDKKESLIKEFTVERTTKDAKQI
tara:strand:+ start:30538 stop:30741 length:204 start_codon:yes stop_codon:yes gene_type:complete